jgi:hypothetical protein
MFIAVLIVTKWNDSTNPENLCTSPKSCGFSDLRPSGIPEENAEAAHYLLLIYFPMNFDSP